MAGANILWLADFEMMENELNILALFLELK